MAPCGVSAVMLCSAYGVNPENITKAIFITTRNPIETLLGDSNQDGDVNVIDVVVIVNHIINLELNMKMEMKI